MRPEALLAASDVLSCDRVRVRRTAALRHRPHLAGSRDMPVLLHNVSRTGLLFEAPMSGLQIGQTVDLDLQHGDSVESEIIWSDGRFYGCEFRQGIREERAGVASLASGTGPASSHRDFRDLAAVELGPERNFAITIILALGLWALIGIAVYLAV